MMTKMDDTKITTLEQIREVLTSSKKIAFKQTQREELYGWIEAVLKRFDYFSLRRKAKGLALILGLENAEI